jgi:hypothetical protein
MQWIYTVTLGYVCLWLYEYVSLWLYEFSTLVPLICYKCVNCCHAMNLYCFPYVLGALWTLEAWFWRFWVKNTIYAGLVLMNFTWSEQITLKRNERWDNWKSRLEHAQARFNRTAHFWNFMWFSIVVRGLSLQSFITLKPLKL